jgi:hypothetical protein
VIFPNSPHGYGPYSPYMMRRRWDYFVKNLLGAETTLRLPNKTKNKPTLKNRDKYQYRLFCLA